MTDPLTQLALVGTARQPEPQGPSGPPVDAVLGALPDVPMERRVLLAAGARAAATMAGRRAPQKPEPASVAPPDARPSCSPKAARILGDLLGGHHEELLPEACAQLARARQRLPHALLPQALRVRGDDLRAAVRPVLGERGAWLARMHEPWAWAVTAPSAASFEDLERAWTDGTPAARRELLARARALDPARARAWLEATWATEKADERAALLAGLRTGVAPEDEAFVEAQLRDRASSVREAAQSVLTHLPGSAFVLRMTARADAMLDFKRSALAFVGKRGALTASPPEAVDEQADRDGLGKPPPGMGARAFWLARALAAVPVAHWTARFGVAPEELVAAAEATDWTSALCEGWTRSALVTGEADWLAALWDVFQRSDDKTVAQPLATAMASAILRRMEAADAASRVEAWLTSGMGRLDLGTALRAVPSPWPESLGLRWLDVARRELQGPPAPSPLLATLRTAALALPPACFERALALREALGGDGSLWDGPINELHDVIRLRLDLFQEIAT